jgi:hypothetical protein
VVVDVAVVVDVDVAVDVVVDVDLVLVLVLVLVLDLDLDLDLDPGTRPRMTHRTAPGDRLPLGIAPDGATPRCIAAPCRSRC